MGEQGVKKWSTGVCGQGFWMGRRDAGMWAGSKCTAEKQLTKGVLRRYPEGKKYKVGKGSVR